MRAALAGNGFQGAVVDLGSKQQDRQRRHQHARGDEDEDAGRTEIAEDEGDHEGAEHRRQPAPGIDETDRQRADAGRINFGLIGVEEERHRVVRQGQQHAEEDEQRGGAHLAEEQPEHADAERDRGQQIFALEAVGEERAQERAEGRGDGDDEGVLQALRDGDPLRDQERRHPIGEAVESDRLEDVEDDHHHGAGEIRALPYLGETAAPRLPAPARRRAAASHPSRLRCAVRARSAIASASSSLPCVASQRGLSGTRRRIHQTKTAPSAPISTTQRQPSSPSGAIGTSCHARNATTGTAHELDHLVVGKGAAAERFRHELREIGVDGDELDADADTGDEAPEIEPEGIGLERHDDARHRVPQQREREDRAPAEAIGGKAEQQRAEEETGEERRDEARDAAGAEQPRRGRRQDTLRHKARRDVAGEQEIVELEEAAEREQQHAPPQRGRHRQAIEPCSDQAGAQPIFSGECRCAAANCA